jgi:hypothetical protein
LLLPYNLGRQLLRPLPAHAPPPALLPPVTVPLRRNHQRAFLLLLVHPPPTFSVRAILLFFNANGAAGS